LLKKLVKAYKENLAGLSKYTTKSWRVKFLSCCTHQ